MKTLVTGGARSGKSTFAESLYDKNDNITYVATYIDNQNDQEMKDRIRYHKESRNNLWQTIEIEYTIDIKDKKYILFDCVSIFCSNVLYYYSKDLEYVNDELFIKILDHIKNEFDKLLNSNKNIVLVTNEVGSGLIPPHHLERVYRDLLGKVNCYLANQVDQVYLVVCSIPTKIKGE